MFPSSSNNNPHDRKEPPSDIRPAQQRPIFPTKTDSHGLFWVPSRFELCDPKTMIDLISTLLEKLVIHNDSSQQSPAPLTRFHSRTRPPISVRDYLSRVATFTNADPCCLLIILCYIDKVCKNIPGFTINSLTVHRFIIAGVAVSNKGLSDSFYLNSRYARIGGVTLVEMNLLEKELLAAVDWRLTRTREVLSQYYVSLVNSNPSYSLLADSTEESNMYQRSFAHLEPDTLVTYKFETNHQEQEREQEQEQEQERTRHELSSTPVSYTTTTTRTNSNNFSSISLSTNSNHRRPSSPSPTNDSSPAVKSPRISKTFTSRRRSASNNCAPNDSPSLNPITTVISNN